MNDLVLPKMSSVSQASCVSCLGSVGVASCHVMQYLADFKIGEQDIVGIVDLRAVSLVLRAVSLVPTGNSVWLFDFILF